jgi:hypothetical protein
MSQQAL